MKYKCSYCNRPNRVDRETCAGCGAPMDVAVSPLRHANEDILGEPGRTWTLSETTIISDSIAGFALDLTN